MGAAEAGVITAGLEGEVVLALSRKGRDELRHPRAGLSLPQRKLLTLIDGKRTLREIAAAEPSLHADRVQHDAARLLGRGLVEIEKGWLQPITRPTTVSPVAPTRVASAAARPRAERAAPRRVAPAKAVPAPVRSRRRGSGAVWFGLVAVGAAGIAIGYSLHPAATRPTVAAAPPSSLLRPLASEATGSSGAARPSETSALPGATAQLAAAPPGLEQAAVPAPTAVAPATPRTTVVASPRAVAAAEAAARVAPSAPPDRLERTAAADAQPPTARSTERSSLLESAPAPAAPAAVSAPSPTDVRSAPVVAGAANAVPPAAAVAPAPTAASSAEVPPWARDFAPVAPDADNALMVAVGSSVTPIERVPPIYPRDAVRQGITSGSIRARAIIADDGSVERVEFPAVESRNRVFERPARAALLTWTFPPGERGRVYEVVLNFVAP